MAEQFDPRFQFADVERVACKASIMIEGLSGTGKSGLALAIGYVLADKDWSKVAAVDTENKSLNLFAGIGASVGGAFGKFKLGQLTKDLGFKPSNYIAFRTVAKNSGAEVAIADSISHAWQYSGGVLDMVSTAQSKQKNTNDKYAPWRDPEVQKEKNELLELIRDPDIHVITTVRIKEKFQPGTDENGKSTIVSVGEQQIQQDDLKYEPDLVLHMVRPGMNKDGVIQHPVAKVIKTRYAIFTKDDEYEFTPELLEQLRLYLAEGADPDELLDQQRTEYVQAVKEYLDKNPAAQNVWTVIKADAGYKDTKLADLPLNVLKPLFLKLMS